jgi:hypothetical protein
VVNSNITKAIVINNLENSELTMTKDVSIAMSWAIKSENVLTGETTMVEVVVTVVVELLLA